VIDKFFPWLIGSAPYLLLLTVGISYCAFRAARNPHVYRWTTAALVTALLGWGLRPILTEWPWLLEERFPDWVIFHSLASALLDFAPLGLLIAALAPVPHDQVHPAVETNSAMTHRNRLWTLPRWAWLLIGGGLIVVSVETTASLLHLGILKDTVLALAGGAPCLLVGWWIRNWILTRDGDAFSQNATTCAFAAWLVLWIARPILLVGLLSIDQDQPLSVFLSSLCSGLPISLLTLAVLSAQADAVARQAPARQERSSAGQFLGMCLGGIAGAIVSAVLFAIALFVYVESMHPADRVSGAGAGRGGPLGTGAMELLIGTPVALLLGLLAGGVVTALKLRDRLSLRWLFALGGVLYLAVLGGLYAWNTWRSPTRVAVQEHPAEDQPIIALLYELRSAHPRRPAEVQAKLDAHGPAAVPALIAALNDWQIHHLAAYQLGRLRDPRAIFPLVEFLANPRGLNPYFVNEALQQFDHAAVAAALAEMDRQPEPVEAAVGEADDATDTVADPGVVEKLIATLKQQDEAHFYGRFAAIQALTTLGDPRAVEALYAVLGDETAREQDLLRQQRAESALLRPAAATALGHFKDPRAFETLTRLVETDENLEVRAGAARGLGTLGDRRAIPLLQRVLDGKVAYEATPLATDLDWFVVELEARDALSKLKRVGD
jgi:HEAT repeat protein